MFYGSREGALEAIATLGNRSCCYAGRTWVERFCDCKYGLSADTRPMSEQTGCPELRTLHALVAAMSDIEWSALTARARDLSLPVVGRHPTRNEETR